MAEQQKAHSVTMALPRYRCHKEVQAAKITAIGVADIDGKKETTLFFGDIGARKDVGMEWAAKHEPDIGGYFVVYADGYESYSPGEAFEDGYTRI